MTDDRRAADDQDQERSRKGSAAAAAGGLAAGGLAQREAIGDLLAGGEDAIDTSPPAGIPDSSLDVFDDMQPADSPPTSGGGNPGSEMPLLRFDAPDVPPVPEDVAALDMPPAPPMVAELPDAEVPADVFNLTDFDVIEADATMEPDEPEPGDIDALL